MNKKGITLMAVVSIVVVITILTLTVSFSGVNILRDVKKKTFAMNLLNVQDSYEILNESEQELDLRKNININVSTLSALEQDKYFPGEPVVSNEVQLKYIDLKELDLDLSIGNLKEGPKDAFAVSKKTKNIYYVKGEKIGNDEYYTLDNELMKLIGVKGKNSQNIFVDGIIVNLSNDKFTNQPLDVEIKIPEKYINKSVVMNGTTYNVFEKVKENGTKFSKLILKGLVANTDIQINYNGKTAVFPVTNIDNGPPTIMVGNATYANKDGKYEIYIPDIVPRDFSNRIKKLKYESEQILYSDAKEYFKTNGINVKDSKIKVIHPRNIYTIYVEDEAGNSNVTHVTIPTDIANKIPVDENNNTIGPPYYPDQIGSPKLMIGMTPVKWLDKIELTTNKKDSNWYDYDLGKWANAKTPDGSYWVWIPRFEYKIVYKDATNRSLGGEILVKIISEEQVEPTTPDYKIHPAFRGGNNYINGEWDKELSGIWVAKYEMSKEINTSDGWVSQVTSDDILGNVTTNSNVRTVSKPNRSSWMKLSIGNAYTNSYNYDRAKDSHLIKNSEWGAVAYFAHSKYGRKGIEISTNTNKANITANNDPFANVNQSTTGNITGIYDLSGCIAEFVAAYVSNGNGVLATNGASFANETISTKYATVYTMIPAEDNPVNNYKKMEDLIATRYGDAMVETSANSDGNSGFFQDHFSMPAEANPFMARGGNYNHTNPGIFSNERVNGIPLGRYGYRVVLCGR